MKKAWVENNSIRDTISGDPVLLFHPDIAKYYTEDVDDAIQNGATLVDGIWVNPAPPTIDPITDILSEVKIVPQSCTRRQGRLALLHAGKLELVERTIAAIPDVTGRKAAQIEYEADTWECSNALLQTLWQGVGGTPTELDDLFIDAVTR